MKAWQREGPCLKYVTDQYTCSSRHLPSFKCTWVTGGYRVAWEPLKSRADFQQHFSAKETDQPGSQSKSPGLRNKTNYSFGETTESVPKPKWDMKVTSVIQCVWLFVPRGLQPSRLLWHGISLARILEWVTISFSRGSSWPRDWTQVSCIASRWFTWATREATQAQIRLTSRPD